MTNGSKSPALDPSTRGPESSDSTPGPLSETVGFIGGGNMATALLRGLVASRPGKTQGLYASDPSSERRAELSRDLGIEVLDDNDAVIEQARVIVFAVKPQVLPRVIEGLSKTTRAADRLFISVAAGTRMAVIEEALGGKPRIIRAMPNTPALVGAGATAIARGKYATSEDELVAQSLFSSVGETALLGEEHLDAITGLSGSGPAFVMLMIEALSDGGVRAGLPRQVATRFAAQTVYGAAKLLLESNRHPGELKDSVTSPGGTTIAGIEALERHGLRGALIAAVQAATNRSRELGQ